MFKQFLLLILFGTMCYAKCNNGVYVASVSNAEKQQIVNKHNQLRLLIANGKVPGQPRGVNLKRMSWDNKLALEAQKIANTCDFKHVKVSDSRWAVGQNLFTSMSTAMDKSGANWNGCIQAWFDEYKKYKFGQYSSATGHYSQVVWANTNKVGCGYTYYKSNDPKFKYQKLYVCNYGPAGNYIGVAPYKVGNSGCNNLC